jgi:hypothetical protein
MSDYEGHRGKLIPTDKKPLQCLDEAGFDWSKWKSLSRDDADDVLDRFNDHFYRGEYALIGDIVYKVVSEYYDNHEMVWAKKNDDGSYNFDVYFYNGGCSFTEALEEAITSADKEGD